MEGWEVELGDWDVGVRAWTRARAAVGGWGGGVVSMGWGKRRGEEERGN